MWPVMLARLCNQRLHPHFDQLPGMWELWPGDQPKGAGSAQTLEVGMRKCLEVLALQMYRVVSLPLKCSSHGSLKSQPSTR